MIETHVRTKRYVLDEEVEDNGAFIARIVVDLLLLQMGVKGVMMLLMLMQRKWILLGELVIEHPPVVLQPTVVSTRPRQRGENDDDDHKNRKRTSLSYCIPFSYPIIHKTRIGQTQRSLFIRTLDLDVIVVTCV